MAEELLTEIDIKRAEYFLDAKRQSFDEAEAARARKVSWLNLFVTALDPMHRCGFAPCRAGVR